MNLETTSAAVAAPSPPLAIETPEALAAHYAADPGHYGALAPHVENFLARHGVLPIEEVKELGGQALNTQPEYNDEDPLRGKIKSLTATLINAGDDVYGRVLTISDELGQDEQLSTQLAERSQHDDINDWDRAALLVCLDKAAEKRGSASKTDPAWGEPAADPAVLAADRAAADQIMAAKKSIAPFGRTDEGYETKTAAYALNIIREYGSVAAEGVTISDLEIFNGMQPSRGSEIKPTSADILTAVKMHDAASDLVRSHLGRDNNEPSRVFSIAPLLDTLTPSSDSPEAQASARRQQRTLLELTSASCYDSSETAEQATAAIEQLAARGVDPADIIRFIPTPQAAQAIGEKIVATTREPSLDMSLKLMTKLAQLPLFKEPSDVYSNSQGQHQDIRESIIDELLTEPEAYADYIDLLHDKIPLLQAANFPLDRMVDTLLGRFNPSTRINIHDDDYEAKTIDLCVSLGDSMGELIAADPAMADRIMHQQFSELLHNPAAVDPTPIRAACRGLANFKSQHPEIYSWIADFRNSDMSLAAIDKYLAAGEHLLGAPQLATFALARKHDRGATQFEPPARAMHKAVESARTAEEIDAFFKNCQLAAPLLADERMAVPSVIDTAHSLPEADMSVFIEKLLAPDVQLAMNDPELREQINNSLYAVAGSHDAGDLSRSLAEYQKLPSAQDFSMNGMLRTIQYLEHNIPRGFNDSGSTSTDRESLIDLYYSMVHASSQLPDKDGNPYDGAEAIGGAIKTIFGLQQARKLSEFNTLLDWYASSGMPYTALPAILQTRHEATGQGIKDEPRQIYDWLYGDPERVDQMSAQTLQTYVSALSGYDGDKTQQAIAEAKQQAAKRQDAFRVFVNVSEAALARIVDDSGQLKTMLDRVEMARRPDNYQIHRSGVEIALGLRSLDAETDHPIYGSCGYVDQELPTGALGYGDVLLTFKLSPALAPRISFTPEDSFHGATRLTAEDAAALRLIKDNLGMGHTRTSDYIESQISGGLNLSEADQIIMNSEAARNRLSLIASAEVAKHMLIRSSTAT